MTALEQITFNAYHLPQYRNTWKLSHIIETQQFDIPTLFNIFALAKELKKTVNYGNCHYLENIRVVSQFQEASSRTKNSFEMATSFLGALLASSTENALEFSSLVKGESQADNFRMLNQLHPDIIIVRFKNTGDAKLAASVSQIPIINAGDGHGQHPTQAILDVDTIYNELGRLDNLNIGLVGDLRKGRTVRSLAYLMAKFKQNKIFFVSPPSLSVNEDIKDYLNRHHVVYSEHHNLLEVAKDLNVLYMTRIQKERGSEITPNEQVSVSLTEAVKQILPTSAQDCIVMHPLPRGPEISPDFDQDPRAKYWKQVENGLFTRMAELLMISNPEKARYLVDNSKNMVLL
ncbi:aspartate carbamoyltransferase [Candidatus Falkowbacteria bacterium CG10_big_fil_rev_8_21_14_0_10_37_14]|uniref:Aspartate carbamoyltransferase n=1 Tax=Candidatus Falkowbacteria bacterium CG10_big_fil_rev_8_21_14_0_10_37_14 TaxID=1974561 RepID=A0A2M6WU68_9BACT|nr:aspartate carbamoyltransferase [Candidatus Falkowbacteria bacterium]PIT96276.1 MAG: aspartate carbamoyltransferase [Candidatus Falkowbacteria bacterium CG10_big_fil_rev_8_21_14_0_10_37_14]